LLARAERLAKSIDSPLASFEIARTRARILDAMDRSDEARLARKQARVLAHEHGWARRSAEMDALAAADSEPDAA
jgi:hypothetical protein